MVSLSLVSDPNWPTLYARCMRETQTATARPYRNIRLDSSSYSGPRTDESPLVCSNLPGSSDVWRTSGGRIQGHLETAPAECGRESSMA